MRMSQPYGPEHVFPFRNILATFQSDTPAEEVQDMLKRVEQALGRFHMDKDKGKVIIDIDLIQVDEEIIRPEDYERSYVQELLHEVFE